MGLEEAKNELLNIIDQHFQGNPKDFASFIHFANVALHKRFEEAVVKNEPDALKKQVQLEEIIEELKQELKQFGESPNEVNNGYKHYPTFSEDEAEPSTREGTLHLDSFLYTDEDVDELAQQGVVPRSYCADCGSKNTKFLNYFSNSLSVDELETIFGDRGLGSVMETLQGKKIVDIGSRIGAVLYYAYIFTEASEIIGVEVDPYFAQLSQRTVNNRKMNDRVRVVQSDVFDQIQLVHDADIVIMHNIFEMFYTEKEQRQLWERVKRELIVKPGQILITNPDLAESLSKVGIDLDEFQFGNWVKEIPLKKAIEDQGADDHECQGCDDDCAEDCEDHCNDDHDHHHHSPSGSPIHIYQIQ